MSNFEQHFFETTDGLKIAYRRYGPQKSDKTPVLCLAGLTRNGRDFHNFASAMCADRPIIVPDMRGRGLSDYASDISTYTVVHELTDVLALLAALQLAPAIVVGTSRGGLLAMMMARLAPQHMAGCVLNDIGPQVEEAGLQRIMAYVGKGTPPTTWAEAATQVKEVNQAQFPNLTGDEWLAQAQNMYSETQNGLKLDYDPRIADALAAQAQSGELADMWPLFEAFKDMPLLTVRGANSDILGANGLQAMAEAKPNMAQITVAGRGHAPFLNEPEVLEAVRKLCAQVDG